MTNKKAPAPTGACEGLANPILQAGTGFREWRDKVSRLKSLGQPLLARRPTRPLALCHSPRGRRLKHMPMSHRTQASRGPGAAVPSAAPLGPSP